MITLPETLRPVVRWVRWPLLVLALYVAARLVFGALTTDDGLLTPGGAPRTGVAVMGLVVLALRIVVVFGLPGAIAYRLVTSLLVRARTEH